jgi:hypothetical protein
MVEDDVFAAAAVLIAKHGEKAMSVAADNFVELQKSGDLDGAVIWTSIMVAIRALTKPNTDESSS